MHEDLPPLGSTVGPWLLLERLDSGSFGVVYRARRAGHPDSPPVAVKMAKRAKDPRFEREGLWTALSGERYPYVVMELVEGLTLYDWFAGGRTSREVMEVLAQVAGALAASHVRGAVHRDVKGDNIRVTAEGRAVLVDWGSGWFAGARPLTDTTAPPGTTAYRPPEQRFFTWRFRKDLEARWQAQSTDDLYSLGVAFYRMVTGLYLPPLSEDGEVEHVREVPLPSDYATISKDLEALILRLLANEREARGTAEALAHEAAALASAAGDAADRPIAPTESARDTDEGAPSSDGLDDEELASDTGARGGDSASTTSSSPEPTRGERRNRRNQEAREHSWALAAMASLVGGLVVALVMVLAILLSRPAPGEPTPRWNEPHQEVTQFAPDAGVADEALSSVQDVPRAVVPLMLTVGAKMPKQPFPGQRKPPCDPDTEIVVMNACWSVLKKESPCGPSAFDYEGVCLRASFDAPRQPTSEEP